jgi:hypothetical protein
MALFAFIRASCDRDGPKARNPADVDRGFKVGGGTLTAGASKFP